MNASGEFRCSICGQENGGPSEDHVLPQALGRFLPNLAVYCTCSSCNSDVLGLYEGKLFRWTHYGVYRRALSIKSANNRGQAPNDPLGAPDSPRRQHVDVQAEIDGRVVRSSFRGDQPLLYLQEEIEVQPAGRETLLFTPAEIAPAPAADLIAERVRGVESIIKYNAPPEYMSQLFSELKQRKVATLAEPTIIGGPRTTMISAIITQDHLRGFACLLYKAIIFSLTDPRALSLLRDFIRHGVYRYGFKATLRGVDGKSGRALERHEYTHAIEWRVTATAIYGWVAPFINSAGFIAAEFVVPLAPYLVIPGHHVVYGGYHRGATKPTGWWEHYVNRHPLQSSRPLDVRGFFSR